MISVPHPVLETLCASFSIDPRQLAFLGGGGEQSEGVVYTFPYLGLSRVLKIGALPASDPAGFLRLEERLKFVHFLAENEVNIVCPLAQQDGSLFASVQSGEHIFVAYIMDKVDGKHPRPEQWDSPYTRSLGKTIGRTHHITQRYATWQCQVVDPISGKAVLGWMQEWDDMYRWCTDKEVKQHWLEMRKKLETLPVRRDSFGFIHNDPHNENILVTDGDRRIVLLDFDVANYHWFITDISIAMQGLLFAITGGMDRPLVNPAPLNEFLEIFMQGYETENHLDSFWLGKLDLLISYRRMLLFTVMQGWLKTKPRMRAVWKRMILDDPPLVNNLL